MLLRIQHLALHRWATLQRQLRDKPDAGYSTETLIWSALLAAAALTVGAIVVAKLIAKANAINLTRPPCDHKHAETGGAPAARSSSSPPSPS